MPYLAGGIFKGAASQNATNNLCNRECALIDSAVLTVNNDLCSVSLRYGFYERESSQEKVTISYDKKSLLCGRLFLKATGEPVTVHSLDSEAIKRSHGKVLAEQYWGRYLFITFDDNGITFYRDPQGLSVLYYTQIEDGYLFSTSLAPLVDTLSYQIDFNWTYLTSFIASNHQLTSVTPFKGVYEILPGCSTQLSRGVSPKISQFWDPTALVSTYIEDETSLQQKIYDTARMNLSSWVYGATKINLQLSGGLDSSSLLGLLRESGYQEPIQAVNLYDSVFADADERDYAQDVCDLYQVPVSYIDMHERLPFGEVSITERYDRPSSALLDTRAGQAILALEQIEKNDERLCGQGGDHLFLAPPPQEALLDYILGHRLQGIGTVLKDLCAFYRMPYLSLLGSSVRKYVSYRRGTLNYLPHAEVSVAWMTDDFRNMVDSSIFKPIFWESLKKVHPGKAQHILAILSSTLYIDRGSLIPGKPIINPLLSQPLVELALSIPTYQSFRKGYDRYQYRKSMDKHLKGKFIWRTSKGGTTGSLIAGARLHFEKLRPLLLEGQFVQRGYIEREKLNYALLELRGGKTDNVWPLLNLFFVEKWLDSWKSSIHKL